MDDAEWRSGTVAIRQRRYDTHVIQWDAFPCQEAGAYQLTFTPPDRVEEWIDDTEQRRWISGQRKAYDEVYYLQKYVPRRPRSRWSQVNVAKVEELIAAGRMRPSGLAEVEAAKADGRWGAAYRSQRNATVQADLAAALAANQWVAQAFDALSKTQQCG